MCTILRPALGANCVFGSYESTARSEQGLPRIGNITPYLTSDFQASIVIGDRFAFSFKDE